MWDCSYGWLLSNWVSANAGCFMWKVMAKERGQFTDATEKRFLRNLAGDRFGEQTT